MKVSFAAERPVTVVIDEFQEFIKVNPSVFSGIQKIWDLYKDNAKINLIVSGSVYTLIQKIFKSKKAALYGRETAFIKIDPFRVSVLKEILGEYSPGYSNEDLLALWSFTGGVAKYVEMLIDARAFTKDAMIDFIIREDSPFVDEGRAVLVDEFGKEYGTYFSILSAIATGRTSRNEISQTIGRDAGGYLTRLVAIGLSSVTAAYFLFSLIPNQIVFLTAAFLIGAGLGLVFPGYQTMCVNLARHDQRGTATSTYLTGWDLGIGIGILVGGPLAEAFSYSTMFLFCAALLLVSAVFFVKKTAPHYLKNRLE